jgi:ubiquinone/menaquinone biosynthesis C-methylase UbiE
MGAHVFAIDISQEAINVARIRLHHYGREDAVSFEVMTVESLHYPEAMFDVVVGEYILHHVEVDLSAAQISRVLKPGGQAIFFEWLRWGPFDSLRSQKLIRKLFPPGPGDVTDDERKIDSRDMDILHSRFSEVSVTRFWTLARLRYFWPRLYTWFARVDHWSYRYAPFLRQWGGAGIITLVKRPVA